jgi:hypothetical protein
MRDPEGGILQLIWHLIVATVDFTIYTVGVFTISKSALDYLARKQADFHERYRASRTTRKE